ncbi:hypothetical protein EV360DRAFT_81376 [Lentinula raphanica]|nr:hypothetical protein EV360DRAFT_81376 [Lentinula raphanica]
MSAASTDNLTAKSLELRPTTSSLPTLAIIAPTPRTFTFPAYHNLDISPYSTPSNSPFEPDLNNSFELSSPASSYLSASPITSPLRSISPDSSASVSSPLSDSPDAERRPQKGDEGYIKRPENAFILFRRKWCEERQIEEVGTSSNRKKERQADLSKTISQKWKELTKSERQYWEDLAKEKKREHQERYPDYVFRPQRVRDKDGRAKNRKYTKRNRGRGRKEKRVAEERTGTTYLIPSGQSPSASNAPPSAAYHTIHIPIIPAIPAQPETLSSSFLPASQMGQTFSGTVGNITSHLGYNPSSNLMLQSETALQVMSESPSWNTGALTDDTLLRQSSELMRNIFNLPSSEFSQSISTQPQPLSISPLSSVTSSPVSGPFTPTTDFLNQTTLDDTQLYPYQFNSTNACGTITDPVPQAPAQAEYTVQPNIVHDHPSWETHDTIWRGASSMLSRNDFDLQVIPPIELDQRTIMHGYGEDQAFGIAPAATLNDFALHALGQEYFLPMDHLGDENGRSEH